MHRPRRTATVLLLALLLSAVLVVAGTAPAGAGSGNAKACKLLKPAQIEKVLGAPAKRSDIEPMQVAGAESCAYDVGPGLGEPGGGMVVVTYYSGPIVQGIGADIKTRAEPVSKGVVWDELISGVYVIKPKKIIGISISHTRNDPPAAELKPEAAKLVKAAARRA